jgi:L-fuconolactonase
MALEWADADQATRFDLMTEVTLAYMRAVGVDRAVLHPISSLEWGEYAAARLPCRFSLVVGALVASPDSTMALRGSGGSVPIESIDDWISERKRTPGTVGIRLGRPTVEQFDPALKACVREGLPIFVLPPSKLPDPREYGGDFTQVEAIARQYPDLTVVIDHLGLPQWPATLESPPFRSLPGLLELAKYPNVAIKFAGAHSMSQHPYPFDDLRPHLRRIVDAFGAQRLMWGTDISRFYERIGFAKFPARGIEGESAYVDGIAPELNPDYPYVVPHTYAQALFHLQHSDLLSAEEKEWVFGRSAQELLGWP